MKDALGREIDYMRLSITDRCDLRCSYCMPADAGVSHADVLRYEEILRVVRAALRLGVDRFKVTGGEPLARRGAVEFIAALKAEPGVACVTLTTNGTRLKDALPRLVAARVDGINVSLDAVDPALYEKIAGRDRAREVLEAIRLSAASGVRTKVNSVLLPQNETELIPLASLAKDLPVDVRFIELMPVGFGRGQEGPGREAALARLKGAFPDLRPVAEKRGNGPAEYYASARLLGRIGFIAANSHAFCQSCNRIRLTSTGRLKPCLCYEDAVDLRALLRGGADEAALVAALSKAILQKPAAHCFSSAHGVTEHCGMNEIGG